MAITPTKGYKIDPLDSNKVISDGSTPIPPATAPSTPPLVNPNANFQRIGGASVPESISSTNLSPVTAPTITPPPVVAPPSIANLPTYEAPKPETTDPIAGLQDIERRISGFDVEGGIRTRTVKETQALNEINKRIGLLQAREEEQAAKARQMGETSEFARGEESNVRREAAVEALTLSALASAAQGDLLLANDLARDAVKTEFEKLEKDAETKRANIIDNWDNLTSEQKKRAEETLRKLDAQDAFIKEEKQKREDIQKIALDFVSKGGDLATAEQIRKEKDPIKAQSMATNALPKKGIVPGVDGKLSSITESVISNPSLFYNFTPTQKAQIITELQSNGYDISGLQNSKLSTSQQEDIAQMSTVNNLIGDILEYNKDGRLEGIGAFGGGSLKAIGAQIGFGSEESKSVRALIGNIKGTIAKLRGGTSFTANEEKILNTYTPSINDSSSVAINKLHLLQDFIAQKNADLLQTAQQNITKGQINKVGVPAKVETLRSKYNY